MIRSINREMKRKSIIEQLYQNSLHILLTILSLMIVLSCFQDTINYDEFFSMEWCRWEWKAMWQRLINDVHPPLYYLLLKLIVDLTSGNMFCARIFSVICCIIMLVIGGKFLERNVGKKAAIFFICITYLNPFMIQKSTEIRMYMLASAFSVASGVYAYKIMKFEDKKDWIYFTISSLLAAYTQYYALLTMCFLYAGIFVFFIMNKNIKQIKNWMICAFFTILGYLPWLPIAIRQITTVNGGYWITMPSSKLGPVRELFWSRVPHSEKVYMGIMISLLLMALVCWVKYRTVELYWVIVCNSAIWGILFFSIVYANMIRPILVSRYLIMATCLSFLGLGYMIKYFNKYVVIIICSFFVVVGALRYESVMEAQNNRNTTELIELVENNVAVDDSILHVSDGYGYVANCIQYYFPNINFISVEKEQLKDVQKIVKQTTGDIWFFDVQGDIDQVNDVNVENWGEFGFNTTVFQVYRLGNTD